MSKISDTLISAGGNLARPTRFTALIAPPPEITSETKIFDVLCKEVQIPDTTMEPIEIQYKGHNLKLPGRVNQDQTIEVTLYLDEYHNMRQMFSNWISGMDDRFYAVNSEQSNSLLKSNNRYGNLIIKSRDFNESNNEVMNYLFEGVYPISVSGPNFGSSSIGEVSEITVTFAYFRFITGLRNTNTQTGSETGKEYDSHDEYLSTFGPSAQGIEESNISDTILNFNGLQLFGEVSDIVTDTIDAFQNLG